MLPYNSEGIERREASRFLLDVPDDLVDVRDTTGLYLRARSRNEQGSRAAWLQRRSRCHGCAADW